MNEEWALHAGTAVEAVWQTTLGGESLLSMQYWSGQQWVTMTGTLFPTAATTETLTCSLLCGESVTVHPEAAAPEGWREYALPCSMFFACPKCIVSYGNWSALRRNAEDIHRHGGGCSVCHP